MASWLAAPLPSPAPRGPGFTVMTFSHLAVKLSKKTSQPQKSSDRRDVREDKPSAFC